MRVLHAVFAAVLLLPSAAAQAELELYLKPERDRVEVDAETRRGHVVLHLEADARNFVCAQGTTVQVHVGIDFGPVWAGASPDPERAEIHIPAGEPGAWKRYAAKAPAALGIYWADDRPREGAEVAYRLFTNTRLDACTPAPRIIEDEVHVTAWAKDLPPPEPSCDADTGLGCEGSPISATAAGEVPSPAAAVALGVLAVFAWRRRLGD
jgi:hypothetical protein